MHPAAAQYQALLQRLDRWFDDTARRHPGVLPCRAGCSACCHGPFDISVADVLLLREGLAVLPPETRALVQQKGQRLLGLMQEAVPEWRPPWDVAALDEERFDGMTEALAAEPCPLLDEAGSCRVYAHRPLVCRLIGLPMLTEEGELLENACPIQDDFPAYASLDPQLFDLGALHDAEGPLLDASSPGPGFETVIAAVVAGT